MMLKKVILATVFALLLSACGRPQPQIPQKPALPYEQVIEKDFIEILTMPNSGAFVDYIQPGTYTITEEFTDENGTLWGKLESGLGWVDLSYVRLVTNVSGSVSAVFASLEDPTAHHVFLQDDSQAQWRTGILFRTTEKVSDITLSLLDFLGEGFAVSQELYHLDTWTPEEDFLAGVIFFGDFTTYGLSYTDKDGTRHHCSLSLSGRDGSIFLQKYTPYTPE